MPRLQSHQLLELGIRILRAAGASDSEARIVAEELQEANLLGHDSHGVMRLVQYTDAIRAGGLKPGQPLLRVRDEPALAVLDGRFGFGQVVTRQALDLGIEKARHTGTATILVRDCNHVGRLGSYTRHAALQGFAALMAVNAPGPGAVAPFGGIDRRLGTNPICMAAPTSGEPLVLDMTTSATAEGKLRVSHQKGESIPPGLIIDGLGQPSTDPGAFYREPVGAILPLGAPLMGHKGFGLSVMIDVFCGILSGAGIARAVLPRGANGVWLQLLHIEHFLPRSEYDQWMASYIEYIRSSRLMPGVSEILLPGEIEARRKLEREKSGVDLPVETWRQISDLAARLGVSLADLQPI